MYNEAVAQGTAIAVKAPRYKTYLSSPGVRSGATDGKISVGNRYGLPVSTGTIDARVLQWDLWGFHMNLS